MRLPPVFNRRTGAGLAANAGAAVLLALLTNLFLLFVPPGAATPHREGAFEVPGAAIGAVWTLLFAVLGAARWLLASTPQAQVQKLARWPVMLLAFCAAYPFYTLGLRSITLGLVGDVLTVTAAALVAWKIAPGSRVAALLSLLVAAWAVFATWLTLQQMG